MCSDWKVLRPNRVIVREKRKEMTLPFNSIFATRSIGKKRTNKGQGRSRQGLNLAGESVLSYQLFDLGASGVIPQFMLSNHMSITWSIVLAALYRVL